MKRIISILLFFVMSISGLMFDTVSAEAVNYDESWSVLNGIGVINYDDAQKAENITRAEFADVMAHIIAPTSSMPSGASSFGKADIAEGFSDEITVELFTDVNDDNEYYNSIKAVSDYGLMKGNPDGSFEPDKKLKYEEIVKTLIVVCGYNDEALVRGGWFSGYALVARRLGITLDNRAIGEFVTKSDTAELIYRAFDVDVRKTVEISGGVEHYSNETSFLREFLKMEYIEGTVTEVENSTVNAPKTNIDENFVVDGVVLKNKGGVSANEFLGRRVKAFYDIDDDANTLLYVLPNEKKDATIIDAQSISGYENGVLEYYNGNNRAVKINISGMPLIYNGAAMPSYDKSVFDFEVGEVIIVDDNDTKAVIVKKYDSFVVGSKNISDDIVYSKHSNEVNLDLSSDNFVRIYDKKSDGGGIISIDDIVADSAVTYLKGSNYVEVYVCDDYLIGVAESAAEDEITVDGKTYELTDSAIDEPAACVGKSIKLWRDIFGNVFKVEFVGASNNNSGVIAAISSSDGFGRDKVKVFLSDGTFGVYNFADKVKFYKNNSLDYVKIDGSEVNSVNGLNGYIGYITFKLNTAGEISVIKLPLKDRHMKYDGDGRVLEIAKSAGKANNYMSSTQSMGNDLYFDDSTIIFNIPKDTNDYDEYCITNYSQIANYEIFVKDSDTEKYLTYWNDLDDPIPDALVIDKSDNGNATISLTNLWVVTKISKIISDKGDIGKQIRVVNALNEEKIYWTTQTTKSGANLIDEVDNLARGRLGGAEAGRTGTVKLSVGDMVFVEAKKDSTEIDKIGCLYDCDKLYMDGGKLGGFAPSMSGSDRYYVNSVDGYDETVHSCISDALVHKVNLTNYSGGTYDVDQNPIRIQSNNIDYGAASLTNKEDGYRGCSGGNKFTLGYVAKKAPGFVYVTTQDLSIDGAVYDEDGDPLGGDVQSSYIPKPGIDDQAGRIGIFWQEWHKYVASGSYILLVEYYDRNVVQVRKATPDDILSYEEAGNNASRFLACPQSKRFFVINDYRTARGGE